MTRSRRVLWLSTAAGYFGAIALLLAQLACGASDCATCPELAACPTPRTPTPQPTPAATGYWLGSGLADGQDSWQFLQFTLANDQARNAYRNVQHTCGMPVRQEVIEDGPWPVVNKQFVIPVSRDGWSGTIVVRFESDVRGTADWNLARTSAPCAGTTLSATFPVTRLGQLAR